jgi:serine/threonine protein kinase/Tol biopolymer transport system component
LQIADCKLLISGSRLGPYEILGPLGAGGMGEVYRARDTNLSRDIAIKVLPDLFASDPDRLARFEREARTLAALNHSNIAQIFGLETSGSVRALAMELVEGPTLAERLVEVSRLKSQGSGLPLDEALPIARQMALALEAAHDHGIVHRDLKPANIKVRPDGTVKVLDFGLATFAAGPAGGAGSAAGAELTNSPTMMASMPGMILGTAGYMSPEQARGKAVDKRADIWAFGCVLFEMLSGRRAFGGETVSDVVAAVLKTEPEWSMLPAATPVAIWRLLGRCLAKDPRERLHDIADARLELDEAQSGPPASADAAPPRRRERLAWIAALALVSLSAVVLAFLLVNRQALSAPEMRLEIVTPPTTDPASLALSPDGQQIAFVATVAGRPQLWLRSLNSVTARALAGTEGAEFPFWAPHGRSLGFFADDGKLKRIDVDGGAVRVLANANLPRGGTWNRDDTILFVPSTGSILRIAATGGEPAVVTRLGPQQSNHVFPQFLPDGDHFVYYVSGSPDVRGVYVAALSTAEGRRLVDADAIAAGFSSGYLLFARGTTVFAQQFDLARLQLTGNPFPVADSIVMRTTAGSQVAALSASAGRIVYRTGSAASERQFVWFDRSGREVGKVGDPMSGNPLSPSLSTDQRRLALHRNVGGNTDIWLLETGRGGLSRFTSNAANEIHPLWSPDGSRILFSSNRTGAYALYEKSTIGPGGENVILPETAQATDWSRDGRFVLLQRRDPKTSTDIWALPVGTNREPFPVVRTDFDERFGQFSPDGKWIAYESIESGRWEIYVQPFPGPGARVPISVNGGAQVRWRADGRELFFIALDDRLMAVRIALPSNGGSAEAGAPVPLFATRVGGALQSFSRQQYFVSPDGQRFLMNTILQGGPASPITVIVNWTPHRAGA